MQNVVKKARGGWRLKGVKERSLEKKSNGGTHISI